MLLLVLFMPSVAAEELPDLYHIVAYYTFDIKGKSSENLIREMIVPPGGDPPYSSPEAMIRALDAKRDRLNNMRLFEEVSYTYEAIHADDVAIRYRVKFFIDDAFTFLAIPYPKYDSNYGFRLGVKAYDTNLFGSFADLYFVINTTQIDNSWEDYEWNTELAISSIPVGPSRIDIDLSAEAVQHGTVVEGLFWTGAIDWQGIRLAQTSFDFHVDIDENTDTEEVDFDKWLTASVKWSGLPWFGSSLTAKPSIRLKQDADGMPWNVDRAEFYSSVDPILINGERYIFSNTFKVQFPHDFLQSTTSLSLADASVFGMPVSFWVSADNYFDMELQHFYDNTYSVGTGLTINLPWNISYQSTYGASWRDLYTTVLDHVPMVSTTQTLSFGQVNWKQNFRHGMRGTISGRADYAFFSRDVRNLDYLNYSVQSNWEAYLKLGKRLGFSTRALGFYAHVPSFDWYHDQQFPTFLPNTSMSPSEQLRGVLDDTYESMLGTGDHQKLGAVLNMDATLMFLKFKGFAEGFISAFMDVGIFTDTRLENRKNDIMWNDVTIFKTVGLEGYGIMDKFPSYPIRGSLGFNLDDVMRHLNGEIGFTDIEYELTIGMGLHY